MPVACSSPAQLATNIAADASLQATLRVAGSCAGCCVRQYCAHSSLASSRPPDNCPFGPGRPAR